MASLLYFLYFLHFLQILHLLHLFHDSLSSNPHLFSFFFEKNDDIFSPLTPEGAIVILNEVKGSTLPTLPTPPSFFIRTKYMRPTRFFFYFSSFVFF